MKQTIATELFATAIEFGVPCELKRDYVPPVGCGLITCGIVLDDPAALFRVVRICTERLITEGINASTLNQLDRWLAEMRSAPYGEKTIVY